MTAVVEALCLTYVFFTAGASKKAKSRRQATINTANTPVEYYLQEYPSDSDEVLAVREAIHGAWTQVRETISYDHDGEDDDGDGDGDGKHDDDDKAVLLTAVRCGPHAVQNGHHLLCIVDFAPFPLFSFTT